MRSAVGDRPVLLAHSRAAGSGPSLAWRQRRGVCACSVATVNQLQQPGAITHRAESRFWVAESRRLKCSVMSRSQMPACRKSGPRVDARLRWLYFHGEVEFTYFLLEPLGSFG